MSRELRHQLVTGRNTVGRRVVKRVLPLCSPGRMKHVCRAVTWAYELFELSGPSYIVATSITPTVLQQMSAADYDNLLTQLLDMRLSMHLQEQAPEGENDVTASDELVVELT